MKETLRKMVEYGLDNFKLYWERDGVKCDYEIEEYWVKSYGKDIFTINIFLTVNNKLLRILYESGADESQVWLQTCYAVSAAGISRIYESTVLMARNHDEGMPKRTPEELLISKYPLTPEECFNTLKP